MIATRRAALAIVSLLLAALAGSTAYAQDSVAASSALFDKGLKNMLAGRYSVGCPQLAESYRLDPAPGTLFTLAECERKGGKIATALARYDDYLQLFNRMSPDEQAHQRGRDKVSKTEHAALEKVVPELTLKLPANAPANTVVKLDGKRFDAPSLGVALPVDPGAHAITTQAPGAPTHTQHISIKKGERKSITLVVALAPTPPATHPAAPPVAPATPAPEPGAEQRPSHQKTWAYVLGGVGIAGIGVGSVTGLLAMSKKSTVDSQCSTPTTCSPTGKQAADSGKSLALVSTIGFGVGAAGLISGVVLWLTAPAEHSSADRRGITPTAGVGPTGGWLGASGRF